MAYSAPSSRSTSDLITAAIWNADVVANPIAIYAGAMSVTSQAVGDILYASSTTQFARVGIGSANKVLTSSGSAPQWSTSLDLAGTLDVTGATTLDSTLGVVGAVTFNDAGADVDFRVESDDGTHTLFVDGGADTVGINNSAPGSQFEVAGDATNTNIDSAQIQIVGASDANQQLRLGYHTGSDYGWIQAVKQGTDQKPLILQAAGGAGVGIGAVIAPDGTLHVHTATAGSITADATADNLIVENSAATGITILAPNNYASKIAFGSPDNAIGFEIGWTETTALT